MNTTAKRYSNLYILTMDGEEIARNQSSPAGLCIDARGLRRQHPDADITVECITDDDDNPPFGFHYSPPSEYEFPELKGRRTVRLYQRDDGFVRED